MELINSEYLQYFHTFYHKPLFPLPTEGMDLKKCIRGVCLRCTISFGLLTYMFF